jgi:hypothetical protein
LFRKASIILQPYLAVGVVPHQLAFPGLISHVPSKTDWTNWLDMYVWSSGLVVLVSDLPVKEAVNSFTAALEQAAPDLRAALSESEDEVMSIDSPTWVDAYGRHRESLDAARVELLERMATAVATE